MKKNSNSIESPKSTTESNTLSLAQDNSDDLQLSPTASNMFGFFNDSLDEGFNGLAFTPVNTPSATFKGSIDDFIQSKIPENIDTLVITGAEISAAVHGSSITIDRSKLEKFFELVEQRNIKKIDFTACELKPEAGEIIAKALKHSKVISNLSVTTNELKSNGMCSLLEGVEKSSSLKTLTARSYNVQNYSLGREEMEALAKIIKNNKTLERISFPNNLIDDHQDALESYKLSNPGMSQKFDLPKQPNSRYNISEELLKKLSMFNELNQKLNEIDAKYSYEEKTFSSRRDYHEFQCRNLIQAYKTTENKTPVLIEFDFLTLPTFRGQQPAQENTSEEASSTNSFTYKTSTPFGST